MSPEVRAEAPQVAARPLLAEQVVTDLVGRILDGAYPPGEAIPPEADLAAGLGVGRSTIREAIRRLLSIGMVEIRRGTGTFVRPAADWSPFDPIVLAARSRSPEGARATTRKLVEARSLVETGVAELAAERADTATLVRMADAVARMEAASDVDEFVAADLDFHQALLDAAANPYVTALFQPLESLIQVERRRTSEPRELWAHAIAGHREILQAVAAHDAAAARAAMTAHLDETIRNMEAFWRTEDGA